MAKTASLSVRTQCAYVVRYYALSGLHCTPALCRRGSSCGTCFWNLLSTWHSHNDLLAILGSRGCGMVACHWVVPSTQTTITTTMDPARRALTQSLPAGVADTYANRSEYGHAPLSTVIHRDHGRRSREEHAESQQYLTRDEEKALVRFLLLKSSLGQPVRIKFVRSLAFSIAR